MDTLLDDPNLCRDSCVLPSKNFEAEPCDRWNAIIFLVRNNSNSSTVPLRPLAEMMPSSARCPRIAFDSIVR
jgi:hypothetical protein